MPFIDRSLQSYLDWRVDEHPQNFRRGYVKNPVDVMAVPEFLGRHGRGRLWLDATTIKLGEGEGIAAWYDRTPFRNDGIQATASAQPTFRTFVLNKRPVARGDATDDRVGVTNVPSILFAGSSFTSAIVFIRATHATTNLRLFALAANADNVGGYGIDGSDTAMAFRIGDGVARKSVNITHRGVDVGNSLAWIVETGVSEMAFDRGLQEQITSLTGYTEINDVGDLAVLARIGGASAWSGDVAEMVLQFGRWSQPEINAWSRYVHQKWGIKPQA